MSRYAQRTLIQQGSVANWGKAAPTGIGVVGGYGVATGGSSSSITVSSEAYTLLTFTADGNLVVSTAGLFDILMFGGGGVGAHVNSGSSGGGGAGGILQSTVFLAAATYAVDIGAGATFQEWVGFGTTIGTSARSLSVAGGGAGGAVSNMYGTQHGKVGGSGGGGGANDTPVQYGGLSVADTIQGYGGGTGSTTSTNGGAGGGGATAIGASGSGTTAGAGGAGYDVSAFISGSALFKAGGGGGGSSATGGAGGSSVGGAGGSSGGAGSAAAANTASGGGGNGNSMPLVGVAGGSGIAYIRFKV